MQALLSPVLRDARLDGLLAVQRVHGMRLPADTRSEAVLLSPAQIGRLVVRLPCSTAPCC